VRSPILDIVRPSWPWYDGFVPWVSRTILLMSLGLTLVALPGCVRRTVTIDSQPQGAIVWLNDREVGRTPVDVDFVFYGTYDVRLVKEGYEPRLTYGRVRAPLWDMVGLDLAAELFPVPLHSQSRLEYPLARRNDDPDALRDRAWEFRRRMAAGR
jgi:hypothetical protein